MQSEATIINESNIFQHPHLTMLNTLYENQQKIFYWRKSVDRSKEQYIRLLKHFQEILETKKRNLQKRQEKQRKQEQEINRICSQLEVNEVAKEENKGHYCQYCDKQQHCDKCCYSQDPKLKDRLCGVCKRYGHPEPCCPVQLKKKQKRQPMSKVVDHYDDDFIFDSSEDPNTQFYRSNIQHMENLRDLNETSIKKLENTFNKRICSNIKSKNEKFYYELIDNLECINDKQAVVIFQTITMLPECQKLYFYAFKIKLTKDIKDILTSKLKQVKAIGTIYIQFQDPHVNNDQGNDEKVYDFVAVIKGLWASEHQIQKESLKSAIKDGEFKLLLSSEYYAAVTNNWVWTQDKEDFNFFLDYY